MHTIRDEFFTPTIALNARFAVLTLQSVSLAYHFEHRLTSSEQRPRYFEGEVRTGTSSELMVSSYRVLSPSVAAYIGPADSLRPHR